MYWVGSGWVSQLTGWVGSGHTKWTDPSTTPQSNYVGYSRCIRPSVRAAVLLSRPRCGQAVSASFRAARACASSMTSSVVRGNGMRRRGPPPQHIKSCLHLAACFCGPVKPRLQSSSACHRQPADSPSCPRNIDRPETTNCAFADTAHSLLRDNLI